MGTQFAAVSYIISKPWLWGAIKAQQFGMNRVAQCLVNRGIRAWYEDHAGAVCLPVSIEEVYPR